jgi:5'-3' exonuclease
MGITGFYSWITANYPDSFVKLNKPIFFNHIYIDLNYLLHMCVYNSPNIKVTVKKIETMILDICSNHHAIDTINICCDGSAPLAKLFLQRIRRLQEARTMIYNKDND